MDNVTRYRWADAPDWATHAATDLSGRQWWWPYEPRQHATWGEWVAPVGAEDRNEPAPELAGRVTRSCLDWRDSLESRPTAKEAALDKDPYQSRGYYADEVAAPGDVSTISPTDSSLTVAAARGDWVPVPREPTNAMRRAWQECETLPAATGEHRNDFIRRDWQHILAAAPSPPTPSGLPAEVKRFPDLGHAATRALTALPVLKTMLASAGLKGADIAQELHDDLSAALKAYDIRDSAVIPPPPMMEMTLHPTTDQLVDRFAAALKHKLAMAERKYGYSDGWADPGWMDECRQHLRDHVEKGDPRDVAAYCAFLWHHGESTSLAAPAVEPVAWQYKVNATQSEWTNTSNEAWARQMGYEVRPLYAGPVSAPSVPEWRPTDEGWILNEAARIQRERYEGEEKTGKGPEVQAPFSGCTDAITRGMEGKP